MCIWFGSWTGTRVPETLSRLRESRFNKDLRRCQDCENRELIHAGARQRHRDILITGVPELPTRDPCSPPLATRNTSHKSVVSLHTCPDRGRKHHISHITHTTHTYLHDYNEMSLYYGTKTTKKSEKYVQTARNDGGKHTTYVHTFYTYHTNEEEKLSFYVPRTISLIVNEVTQ